MRLRLVATGCLALSLWTYAVGCAPTVEVADTAEAAAAVDPFESARLEAALRYLASDELLGRRTGTAGNDSAAAFIATHFGEAGLTPAPGHDGFFQTIPFVTVRPPETLALSLGAQDWEGEEAVLLRGTEVVLDAPVVFVGNGTEANDYANAAGRVAVARVGVPGSGVSEALAAASEKRALAEAAGAVALVELYALPIPWTRVAGFLNRKRFAIQDSDSTLPHAWVTDAEGSLATSLAAQIQAEAMDMGAAEIGAALTTSGLRTTSAASSNVAGFLEGSDPVLKDEAVVLVAHYDHVGAGMTNGAGATPADSIFNGARDNGMGTVALLAAAEALAQNPPRRSVLALAVTAEEEGLLGSRYYVNDPLVPLDRTVFALNTDGAGYSVTDRVTVVGLGRTTVDAALETGVAVTGLDVGGDPAPEQGLFDRSDNVNFAQKGVPTLTFSPGLTSFQDPVIATYYHNAADEVDEAFDFAYLQRFARAYTATARHIADLETRPAWTPGDEYADEAAALYGNE